MTHVLAITIFSEGLAPSLFLRAGGAESKACVTLEVAWLVVGVSNFNTCTGVG